MSSGDGADEARIRSCILTALAGRRAFTASFRFRGYDSTLEHAYAGRVTAGGYEVRRFDYDSCPSGCGPDDPVWSSFTCLPFEDLRAACASSVRVAGNEDLRHACYWVAEEPAPSYPTHHLESRLALWLGLWCNRPYPAGSCP